LIFLAIIRAKGQQQVGEMLAQRIDGGENLASGLVPHTTHELQVADRIGQ